MPQNDYVEKHVESVENIRACIENYYFYALNIFVNYVELYIIL